VTRRRAVSCKALLYGWINVRLGLILPFLKDRHETGILEEYVKNVLGNQLFQILLKLSKAREVLESHWLNLVKFSVGRVQFVQHRLRLLEHTTY
jgi:hypothetical protein